MCEPERLLACCHVMSIGHMSRVMSVQVVCFVAFVRWRFVHRWPRQARCLLIGAPVPASQRPFPAQCPDLSVSCEFGCVHDRWPVPLLNELLESCPGGGGIICVGFLGICWRMSNGSKTMHSKLCAKVWFCHVPGGFPHVWVRVLMRQAVCCLGVGVAHHIATRFGMCVIVWNCVALFVALMEFACLSHTSGFVMSLSHILGVVWSLCRTSWGCVTMLSHILGLV